MRAVLLAEGDCHQHARGLRASDLAQQPGARRRALEQGLLDDSAGADHEEPSQPSLAHPEVVCWPSFCLPPVDLCNGVRPSQGGVVAAAPEGLRRWREVRQEPRR